MTYSWDFAFVLSRFIGGKWSPKVRVNLSSVIFTMRAFLASDIFNFQLHSAYQACGDTTSDKLFLKCHTKILDLLDVLENISPLIRKAQCQYEESFGMRGEAFSSTSSKSSCLCIALRNFHRPIARHFGKNTLWLVWEYERTSSKLTKYKNKLSFNLRCRQHRIIPSSLCLGSTMKGHKAERTLQKAQTQLLSERVRRIPLTTDALKVQIDQRL